MIAKLIALLRGSAPAPAAVLPEAPPARHNHDRAFARLMARTYGLEMHSRVYEFRQAANLFRREVTDRGLVDAGERILRHLDMVVDGYVAQYEASHEIDRPALAEQVMEPILGLAAAFDRIVAEHRARVWGGVEMSTRFVRAAHG